jgi:hypothetical protein
MDQVRSVDIHGYQVVQETHLLDSHWWMQVWETDKPPLIVRYMGRSVDHAMYFFEGRDGKAWLVKGREEIGLVDFKPMLVLGGLCDTNTNVKTA